MTPDEPLPGEALLDNAAIALPCPVCEQPGEVSGAVGYFVVTKCPHCHSTVRFAFHERDGDEVLISYSIIHNPKECDECRMALH